MNRYIELELQYFQYYYTPIPPTPTHLFEYIYRIMKQLAAHSKMTCDADFEHVQNPVANF